MKKTGFPILILIAMLTTLTGCAGIGNKSANMSIGYLAIAIFSFILLFGYFIYPKRNTWFMVLFTCVFIVNAGYYALSVSQTLNGALWANRISYLGSVFLPLAMLMIMVNVCRLQYPRILPCCLSIISMVVFFIAASPGYLDIYYKSVQLTTVKGITVLDKVYGPLHHLYLYYLMIYFGAMPGVIIYAARKKHLESILHAFILAAAMFVNVSVWLLEQLVHFDFELLSVSYIVSELFLLCLSIALKQTSQPVSILPDTATPPVQTSIDTPSNDTASEDVDNKADTTDIAKYQALLRTLTPTERMIFDHYHEGHTSKEIMQFMNIKENTLKYHNKNIYSKLGISSRKQLLAMAEMLTQEK